MAKDRPRLLARASERGYVESIHAPHMAGEPEAIPEEDQRRISTESRAKWVELKSEELARQDRKRWSNRLRQVEQRAYDKGVDVHRYQVEVRRAIVAMEKAIEDAR